MNYMGGKHRQGPVIAKFIEQAIQPGQMYVEPFCGALGVASRLEHTPMLLSDISECVISMWQQLTTQPFIDLPDVVTEDEYNRIKLARDPKDWMTAYVGFGMSFGSKYFGGYAIDNKTGRDYAANLKRSTNLKRYGLGEAVFLCSSYVDLKIPPGSFIYCDPPYAGRTRAHDCGDFDHVVFWGWCREKVAQGHIVLVTEFSVPDDFVVLHNFSDTVVRHYKGKGKDGTSEVLVCHHTQLYLFTKSSEG